jgi:hypothetical protein
MTGLPYLIRLRPLAMPSLAALQSRDSNAKNSRMGYTEGGNFFFDPFANKRGAPQKKELHWVTNEVAQVSVLLCNLTSIDLEIQSIQLVTEGVRTETFSTTLVIPPHTWMHEVVLTVKPLAPGELSIAGIKVRCFNLSWVHKIDDNGESQPPCPTVRFSNITSSASEFSKVVVARSMPMLVLNDWLSTVLPSFHGEKRSLELALENSGQIPITHMEISVATYMVGQSQPRRCAVFEVCAGQQELVVRTCPAAIARVLRWDERIAAKICSSLPLLPQQQLVLPVEITAWPEYSSVEISIAYFASEDAGFKRELRVPLKFDLEPSIELVSVELLPPPFSLPSGLVHGEQATLAPLETDHPSCTLALQLSNASKFAFMFKCTTADEVHQEKIEAGSANRVLIPLERFDVQNLSDRLEFTWESLDGRLSGSLPSLVCDTVLDIKVTVLHTRHSMLTYVLIAENAGSVGSNRHYF